MLKGIAEVSQFARAGGEIALDGSACVDVIRSTVARNACLRLRVRGGSMCPFIADGDIVILAPLPRGPIGLGRAIAFTQAGDKKLIIHRLVGIRKSAQLKYITKGDNLNKTDPPVSPEDILAYVKKVERGGRIILIGTGPERTVIAYLSRMHILRALSFYWNLMIPGSIRAKIKGRLYF